MTDFATLERRMAMALERLSMTIEKAKVFDEESQIDGGQIIDSKEKIASLQQDIDEKDAVLNDLLANVESLTQNVADSHVALERVTQERDTFSLRFAKLEDENIALAAEHKHLLGLQSEPDPVAGDDLLVVTQMLEELEVECAKIKAANLDLIHASNDLRIACEDKVVNADDINASLKASLRAMQANASSDSVELQALKKILTPILNEANNA